MQLIFKLKCSFTYWMVLLALSFVFSHSVWAEVVASGDGFTISSEDVETQKAYFSERGFESTDAEHVNSALKMRLFAIEAKNDGLIASLPEAAGPYKYETVHAYQQAFQFYLTHLMETYPVSEDAILSYYLSYPEKFRKTKDGGKEVQDPSVYPLDSVAKNWIRSQILNSKRVVIIEDEFERLKAKYHAVVIK